MLLRYRQDINGLRAIAVISVVFYHLGLLPGGFIGVDIFFAISGFLISHIIINGIQDKNFSLVVFFERRIARLAPALFFMLIITFIPFFLIMDSSSFRNFSQSIISTVLYASNILFYLENDYFDPLAETKPLIHTWSLAIEEQFYLVFPIILILVRRFILEFLIITFTASFLLCVVLSVESPNINFYMIFTRAWQLLAGAICCFIMYHQNKINRDDEIYSIIGLLGILFSIVFFDQYHDLPGLMSMIPIIGTLLIIRYSSGESTIVSKFLSIRVFTLIGLISYSLYIWHQPIISFYTFLSLDKLMLYEKMILVCVSIIFGTLSYYFVEAPFRTTYRQVHTLKYYFLFSGLILCLGASGIFISNSDKTGMLNPLNGISGIQENRVLRGLSWEPLQKLSQNASYDVDNNKYDLEYWFEGLDDKSRALVIGNSHSKDMYNALMSSRTFQDQFQLARFGVQIRDLDDDSIFWVTKNFKSSDVIIIASRYDSRDVENLKFVIEKILSFDKQVYLIYGTHEFSTYRSNTLTLADLLRYKGVTSPEEINHVAYEDYRDNYAGSAVDKLNTEISHIADNLPVTQLNRMDYTCSDLETSCYIVDGNLNKLFYDYGHYTIRGAQYFGKRIDEVGWLH